MHVKHCEDCIYALIQFMMALIPVVLLTSFLSEWLQKTHDVGVLKYLAELILTWQTFS